MLSALTSSGFTMTRSCSAGPCIVSHSPEPGTWEEPPIYTAYVLPLCPESLFLSVHTSAQTLCCGLCLLFVTLGRVKEAGSEEAGPQKGLRAGQWC